VSHKALIRSTPPTNADGISKTNANQRVERESFVPRTRPIQGAGKIFGIELMNLLKHHGWRLP
jgi:hypothetical protein